MGKINGMTKSRRITPKIVVLFLAAFAWTATWVWGQTNTGGFATTQQTSSDAPKGSSVFLLDPSRFRISHSISTSYASLGGHGVLTSMYLANIDYKLANPLDIRLVLGVANSQGALFGPRRSANSFVPGFQLYFHPSNSFNLIINYQQYPAGTAYYPGLYYRR